MHADLEKKIVQQPEKFTMSIQGEFENKGKKNIVDYALDFLSNLSIITGTDESYFC